MMAPLESWVVAPSTAPEAKVASLTAAFKLDAVTWSPVANGVLIASIAMML
jgi:hypothetical protein